jgi:hypothetical protein
VRRQEGAWQPLLIADVVLNWAVPFLVLLPRAAKRSPGVLAKVCVVLLAGRWLDLYLLIAPPSGQPTVQEVVLQAGLLLGGGGLFSLVLSRALRGALLIPVNDPFVGESLHKAEAAHERSPERAPTGRAEEGGDGRIPQPARAVQAGR